MKNPEEIDSSDNIYINQPLAVFADFNVKSQNKAFSFLHILQLMAFLNDKDCSYMIFAASEVNHVSLISRFMRNDASMNPLITL